MNAGMYNLLSLGLIVGIVWGIRLMSSPRTAVRGNLLGAGCVLGGILLTLATHDLFRDGLVWGALAAGAAGGGWLGLRVTMIRMPQLVALLNGLGGAASAAAALVVLAAKPETLNLATRFTGALAVTVGSLTLSGSLVAAGKLDRRIRQTPIHLHRHSAISVALLSLCVLLILWLALTETRSAIPAAAAACGVALAFGIVFAIRIGGADMPISISLLNSLSGVGGALAGFAVRDPLLVAAGAVVGASGLILTELMCRAANRTLAEVITGRTTIQAGTVDVPQEPAAPPGTAPGARLARKAEPYEAACNVLRKARTVLIVPGYGMAAAGAQHEVKRLADALERRGTDVRFAVHPLAGRMPGHMHVLLAEVDVPYDKLHDLNQINDEFRHTDAVVVVGANDVVNPAANTAPNTPIYGMPILRVAEAESVIICNQDTAPGYSGVPNPLYQMDHVILCLGDAVQTVSELAARFIDVADRQA